jgi:HSP20 family protein
MEVGEVYRESYTNPRWNMASETIWRPPTDVYETDSSVVVVIEIAGLAQDNYEILLRGRTLIIAGERRDPAEKLAYQQMEIRHGRFRTEVHLPWALEPTGQQATYENGFLKIILPKATVRRVPIRATIVEESREEQASGSVRVQVSEPASEGEES